MTSGFPDKKIRSLAVGRIFEENRCKPEVRSLFQLKTGHLTVADSLQFLYERSVHQRIVNSQRLCKTDTPGIHPFHFHEVIAEISPAAGRFDKISPAFRKGSLNFQQIAGTVFRRIFKFYNVFSLFCVKFRKGNLLADKAFPGKKQNGFQFFRDIGIFCSRVEVDLNLGNPRPAVPVSRTGRNPVFSWSSL